MPVTDIGAGSSLWICTAADPMSAHTPTGSDANLVNYSANIKSVPLDNTQGTEDITTLASAALAYAKSYLATLFDPKFQTTYIDNAQGDFYLPMSLIRIGNLHSAGRGIVDACVLIGNGANESVFATALAAGGTNMRADFSMLITDAPFGIVPGGAYGGNFSAQITGGIVFTAQY